MDGATLIEVDHLDDAQRLALVAFLDEAEGILGYEPLSERKAVQLFHRPGRPPSASGDTHEPSMVMGVLAVGATRALIGYAQLDGDRERHQFVTERVVVAPPDAAGQPGSDLLSRRLLQSVVERVGTEGGGHLRLWISHAGDGDDVVAKGLGFEVERDLLQMRCLLPLAPAADARPAEAISTRSFHPGHDEARWLVTNNRAFATHPEQGHWDMATLLEREGEPWFDPEGFRVLEVGGEMVGSCWTKVHALHDPPLGEIYVIGVDPAFHGRGWGRALTLAGLDWLSQQGLENGMLYVDAANDTAVTMYRSMGFVEHHTDRAYVLTVGSEPRSGDR